MNRHRRSIFLMLVLEMVIIGVLIVVAACNPEPTPTETPSPITTPTPNTSPLTTPQAEAGALVVEKSVESEEEKMNAELLGGIAGIVLSLFFSYVPGVKVWFEALKPEQKQALMGALLIVVALAVFGLSCGAIVDVGLTCDKAGAVGLAGTLVAALVANQSIYGLTKKKVA